jgi:RNA polymerase sigma-70 factor (ECF subfamily)
MLEHNDATLVRQCLEGDVKAFERLIDKYQKTIFNVALRMTNDHDDAKDIAQAVFIKAYEKLASFEVGRKFFSWLYRMAVNESLNFINRHKRFEALEDVFAAEDKTPEESYEEGEMAQRVQRALMRLEPEQRALIVLKHFQEMPYQEIGYIFDIPEKTVKSRLFAARQALRQILIKQKFLANG